MFVVEITFIVFSLYLRVFFVKESKQPTTNNQPNCRGVAGYGTTVAKQWPNVVLDICGFCGMEAAELVEAMDEELEAKSGEIWQRCVFVPPYFSDVYKGILLIHFHSKTKFHLIEFHELC